MQKRVMFSAECTKCKCFVLLIQHIYMTHALARQNDLYLILQSTPGSVFPLPMFRLNQESYQLTNTLV